MSRKVVSLRTKRLNVLNTELKAINKMLLRLESTQDAIEQLKNRLKERIEVLMTESKSLLKENL